MKVQNTAKHPQRYLDAGFWSAADRVVPGLSAAIDTATTACSTYWEARIALAELKGAELRTRGETAIDQLATLAVYDRWGGADLHVEGALLELLDRFMDVGKGITTDDLILPFPICYFSFGEPGDQRHAPYIADGTRLQSGLPSQMPLWMEGCFAVADTFTVVNESHALIQALGLKKGESCRAIHLCFVAPMIRWDGQPIPQAGPFDDQISAQSFLLPEGKSLEWALLAHRWSWPKDDPNRDMMFDSWMPTLLKTLLYMSSKSARTEVCRDRTDIDAAIRRTTNKAKRRKLEKQRTRTRDYVRVGETHYPFLDHVSATAKGHAEAGTRAPHVRRGHFRTLHRGTKDERRIVIDPTMIGVSAEERAKMKDLLKPYRVTV